MCIFPSELVLANLKEEASRISMTASSKAFLGKQLFCFAISQLPDKVEI